MINTQIRRRPAPAPRRLAPAVLAVGAGAGRHPPILARNEPMLMRNASDGSLTPLPFEAAETVMAKGLASEVAPIAPGGSALSGTASPGAAVTIFQDGASFATVTADAFGNWSFLPTTAGHVYSASVPAPAGVAPVCLAPPTIPPGPFGPPPVGVPLTVQHGRWSNALSRTFQWLRNNAAIGGATGAAYTPVTADIGTTLSCTVTATNATGSSTVTSAVTLPVVVAAATVTPVAGVIA